MWFAPARTMGRRLQPAACSGRPVRTFEPRLCWCAGVGRATMAKATLTISSKNYSSWSLRGWLLTKFSGLEFDEIVMAPDDARTRGRKSCCCRHRSWCRACATRARPSGTRWPSPNTSTSSCRRRDYCRPSAFCGRIAARSAAKSTPASRHCARRCRSTSRGISRASRSGRGRRPTSTGSVRSGASAWRNPADRSCLAHRTMADAMYAPVVTRFMTYDVQLGPALASYAERIMRPAGNAGVDRSRAAGAGGNRGAGGGILGNGRAQLPAR